MSKLFTRRLLITILIIAIILLISLWLLPNALPLIIAFFSALALEPLVRMFMNRMNLKRNLSVFIVFMLFLCFLGLSSYFIVTKVVTEVVNISENAPEYINEIGALLTEVESDFVRASEDLPEELVDEISNQVTDFLNGLKADLSNNIKLENITNVLTNIPNYLVSFIVYLIALFLFMMGLPNVRDHFYSFLTDETADKVNFMTSRLTYVVAGFFKAQFLVSLIIFFVSLIGLMMIAPSVALVMSLIIWAIDFIPIIGSIVILLPWSLFQFLTGDVVVGTKLAILAAILLIIRRTVEPKVMGQHIGLSPLSTLIAMYLGLKVFGVLGFFIGPVVLIAFNSAREAGIIKMNFKI
ncbi:sporulation integral membrane protein YtvI [Bacillus tianshenii]|nr:sporulation integral membrane protein YtvI [Bacillus tianshenii]